MEQNMPSKKETAVSMSNTKKEILEAYNELLTEFRSKRGK